MTQIKFCFLLLLLSTAILSTASAQEFGGNPPSIKWNQVNTPQAKVIFPTGLDSMALRVANIIRQVNGSIQPTIGYKQKQISILLQNQTTIANAYVGLAPFRSEFYLTPEQNSFDIGSLPWNEQLAIHEFRHVQQYNNFNVGFSHVLKVIFGEGGQALGNDLAIPNWFFEGDAVFNETLVSEQGRGRLPFFYNGFRSLWNDGRDYSYMKLRNGSYRDYTPDWYPLGYMLVSYGREKYGDDFWKKVTQDAAACRGVFYPFQKAVKRYSGENFKDFKTKALEHYKSQFNAGVKNQPKDSATKIPKHFVADREYPAYVNDSTMIYMRSSYDQIPAFVLKSGNKEKKITVRDISLDNYFDYTNGKVVYATYRPDLRWNYRNYSELVVLDINTGIEKRITRKTKYFSPAFNNDASKIVAVDEATSGISTLHILNAADGKQLAVLPNPQKLFYTYPKFYGDDKLISPVRNPKGKMSVAEIDVKSGKTKYLLPFTYQPIAFPVIKNDTLYFSVTSGMNDQIYALSLASGKLKWLSNYFYNGSVGFYQPALSAGKFAWVGFTSSGYRINEVNRNDLKWLDQENICCGLPDFGISALEKDASSKLLDQVKNYSLPVTRYKKSHNLVNFHSLIPNFNDPNYAVSIEGENVLNTLQTQVSFNYNRDEGYKEFGVDAIYGALFPYLSAGANYTLDRRGFYKGGNIYWNETNLHGGLELPLTFTSGKHSTGLAIGSDIYYTQVNFQSAYKALFADRNYTYSNNYMVFSNTIQQARKNIYPRFGQVISLNYKSAISSINANQFLASGSFYLPGFFIDHNFVLSAAHQQHDKGNAISFSNDFPFARGYQAENLYNMNKIGANYHFPIAYPDAGVADLFYLMRIRGNAFYDYTRADDFYADGSKFKGTFRSTGAEVYFDAQLFNQGSVSFGFRYSYLVDRDVFGGTGHNRFEIIVPVTIF